MWALGARRFCALTISVNHQSVLEAREHMLVHRTIRRGGVKVKVNVWALVNASLLRAFISCSGHRAGADKARMTEASGSGHAEQTLRVVHAMVHGALCPPPCCGVALQLYGTQHSE